MNDGWQRPGGPPEITFEIPLSSERGSRAVHDPVPRRSRLAKVALGGAAALAIGAAAVITLSSDPETTAPATSLPATLPPTLPPPAERSPDDQLPSALAALTPPTFPQAPGLPADMLDDFDLGAALSVTTPERITRSVTVVETAYRTLEHRASYDPVNRRDQRILRAVADGRVVFTMILDRDSGQRYRRLAGEFWWRRSGPDSPRDGWTPDVLDSLRLGPVHAGAIDSATAIESGPVTVVADADGRPGPPVRVFHVTLPADRLADSSLAELGVLDPNAANRSDVTFVVYASPAHGVVLVTAELMTGKHVTTIRHFVEMPEEPPSIELPDAAHVIQHMTA